MTQRRKSQSIGLLMTIVFSAVLLWALAAMVQTTPVVHADGPLLQIETITVTSTKGTYFYNPGLGKEGGTVYFNNLAGEGAGQVLTVAMTVTGSMPITLTGAPAFGMTPMPDTTDTGELGITYTIGISAGTQSGIVFTVTNDSETDTAVITFTRDITDPTVEFIDFTDPDYVDADGSNWYDPDNLSAGWYFTSTVTDTLSGPALANAFWDHTTDHTDRFTDPSIDGTGVFTDVASDEDGTVTVTLTITDHVGNSASDTVVFNLDNTGPTIISPTLNLYEPSPFLHADGPMLYYGDEAAFFWVEGEAQDDGAGPCQATYSDAFESSPPDDGLIFPFYSWEGYYALASEKDYGKGTITVTVSDQVGNATTQIFTYTRDITSPTLIGPFTIIKNSPYLHADGTTVYYSHQMESTPQSFTVQGHASDDGAGASGLDRATFSAAFEFIPPADDDTPEDWSGIYDDVEDTDWGDGTITVTVYDNVSNWSTGVFTYIEDTTNPTVTLTYITPPGYDEDDLDDPFDADGSNWYNADDFTADGDGWRFTSYTADDGAGLASGMAVWDHSNNDFDRLPLDCGPEGDGTFSNVSGDAEGTVTVTLTITDHVGNPASATVDFNIDNTAPTITLLHINNDYDSQYLHVDGLTVYYGDEITGVEAFTVHGHSDDGGVGLGSVAFSPALGDNPYNQGTLSDWWGEYSVTSLNTDSGTITATVYDLLDNAADQTFNYIRDTEPPTVDVDCPALTSEPSFLVSWNGSSDPPPASGLKHFDVQYKIGSGGQWQDWHTNTLLTQDTFGPTSPVIMEDDRTYYFRVRAEDNVSNEQYTDGEDATTYRSGVKKVFLPILMAPDPNWGFETGDFTSWQHGGQLAQSVSTAEHHSGNYSALLGSPSYPCNGVPVGSAWLRRSVTVPSSGSPILRFWYKIHTQDYNPSEPWQYDYFAVKINGSEVLTDSNTIWPADQNNCTTYKFDWTSGVVSLDAYKGQTIEITFYNHNRPDKFYNTYTYIDDVSVQ